MTSTGQIAEKGPLTVRILYVEDEPDIRELTCITLRTMGNHDVIDCCSGQEALAQIEQQSDFDLLLLDVMMPEMDGRALLKQLRDRPVTAEVPAIFMTAKTMPTEVEELRALGAVHVVSKPFDPFALNEEISAAVVART